MKSILYNISVKPILEFVVKNKVKNEKQYKLYGRIHTSSATGYGFVLINDEEDIKKLAEQDDFDKESVKSLIHTYNSFKKEKFGKYYLIHPCEATNYNGNVNNIIIDVKGINGCDDLTNDYEYITNIDAKDFNIKTFKKNNWLYKNK